jgi:N-methylhydantoinase B
VVRIVTPSGGGFGDPLERDPALVAQDVRSGLMTPAHAQAVYGVALEDPGLPEAFGRGARRRASAPSGNPAPFSLGTARLTYDRIWPPEVRSELARRVLAEAASIRQPLLSAVRDALTQRGQPVTGGALEIALAEARRGLEGG